MTVSRVINSDPAVRATTREHVQATIAAIGYSPNAAARVLAGAARTRLALLYGNPSSAYLSEVLVGGLAEAGVEDAQLVLEECPLGEAESIARRLIDSHIDGVILPPPFCDDAALLAVLRERGVPVATLASGAPLPGTYAIAIDDLGAARDMTAHLIALGHRRIGFIAGNPNQTASAKRAEGYRQALAAAGIEASDDLVAEGDFSYRSGLLAGECLLDAPDPPSAIFASNDDMAAATVAIAHRRHRDVPGDLSVVGFDDTALATTISPELTTVRQPVASMAKAAVEMLMIAARRRRSGLTPDVEQRLFAHEIIVRASDAPPRLT